MEAPALWQAFRENQVAAEAAFGARDLLVSGVVDHVDLDSRDRIRVHLRIDRLNTLSALLPEAARASAAEIRSGAQESLVARVASVDSEYVVVEAGGVGIGRGHSCSCACVRLGLASGFISLSPVLRGRRNRCPMISPSGAPKTRPGST